MLAAYSCELLGFVVLIKSSIVNIFQGSKYASSYTLQL